MTGLQGSGKSYSALHLCILTALDIGRPVYTNIPLREDEIVQVWPNARIHALNLDDPSVWDDIEGGALIVVDEVWKVWPAGQRVDHCDPRAVEFISMHRHRTGLVGERTLSQEVVLLTQGSKDFATWLRSKIDKTYTIRKLDAVGADRQFRVSVYQGWQDTARPTKSALIRSYVGTYSAKIFQFYVSHTQGDGGSAQDAVSVEELKADRTATVWNSWSVRAAMFAPLVIVACVGIGWYQWDAMIAGDSAKAQPEPKPLQSSPPEAVPEPPAVLAPRALEPEPPPPPPVPVAWPASSEWRLSGWYSVGGGGYSVVLEGADGKRRTVRGADCDPVGRGELVCHIEGNVVASYTGPAPALPSAVLGTAIKKGFGVALSSEWGGAVPNAH